MAHYFLNHGTEQQKRRYLLRMPGVVLVVCETDPSQGARGISSLIVETRDCSGYRVGWVLDKVGMKAQDTSELFFDGVAVAAENLLGGV